MFNLCLSYIKMQIEKLRFGSHAELACFLLLRHCKVHFYLLMPFQFLTIYHESLKNLKLQIEKLQFGIHVELAPFLVIATFCHHSVAIPSKNRGSFVRVTFHCDSVAVPSGFRQNSVGVLLE